MRDLSEERRERGVDPFEYLNNSDVIHWGTGPEVASIRKKLKPEIVIDLIKTIAKSLTLHTVNIIPHSMIRPTKLCIQRLFNGYYNNIRMLNKLLSMSSTDAKHPQNEIQYNNLK